jgi:hypothetical protein
VQGQTRDFVQTSSWGAAFPRWYRSICVSLLQYIPCATQDWFSITPQEVILAYRSCLQTCCLLLGVCAKLATAKGTHREIDSLARAVIGFLTEAGRSRRMDTDARLLSGALS